uniref:OTU domain-containing protein n=1 Tax=Steinernema glaseri TaxID=37863 RepID=A0A1I8AH98_9BILA
PLQKRARLSSPSLPTTSSPPTDKYVDRRKSTPPTTQILQQAGNGTINNYIPKPFFNRNDSVNIDRTSFVITGEHTDINEILKTTKIHLRFKLKDVYKNPDEKFINALQDIVKEIKTKATDNAAIGITFNHEQMENPIFHFSKNHDQIDGTTLANNIEKVIQSNANIKLSDGMEIYGYIVHKTGGSGVEKNNEITVHDENIVNIVNPNDSLCMFRAIVVGKAIADRKSTKKADRSYDNLRKKVDRISSPKSTSQAKEAKQLLNTCKLANKSEYTDDDLSEIQKSYGDSYKILVVDLNKIDHD